MFVSANISLALKNWPCTNILVFCIFKSERVIGFIRLTPGDVVQLFNSSLKQLQNKLQWSSLASFFRLV